MKRLNKRFPIYSKLLGLYPVAYQKQYKQQMLQTLADMLDGAASSSERLIVWLQLVFDFPISVSQQQFAAAGNVLSHETPRFVKRSAVASAFMFLPFFLIVIANDATSHGLYHSWLWSLPILFAWIVIFPALGFIISTTTLLFWLTQNRTKQHRNILRSLMDLGHNWPMTIFCVLGLGILMLVFFHDSVHCVTGNPVVELHNPRATISCIQRR